MNYVDNSLLQDEKVLYKATITRYIYIRGTIVFILGVLLSARANDALRFIGTTEDIYVFALFHLYLSLSVAVIGIVLLVRAFIARATTELAVTSKRIIAKYGFFTRKTIELNHNKFESLSVKQGVLGRILNYGAIIIYGTGGGKSPIKNIDAPLKFREETVRATE
ncbi:MAG: PH domain-containing protein [Nitrosomonadaceae bacterium]